MCNHELDDRGICPKCILKEQQKEQNERLVRKQPREIPDLEEFPTPYEFAYLTMMEETGEWGQ